MFAKLTQYDRKNPIWVNPELVRSFEPHRDESWSIIVYKDESWIGVTETCEELAALLNSKKDRKPKGDPTPSDAFEGFWAAYPRKTGKTAALKAWNKIKPAKLQSECILQAVIHQCQCEQWKKDNGQFIPLPTTWLNQGRWQDEVYAIGTTSNPEQHQSLAEQRKAELEAEGVKVHDV